LCAIIRERGLGLTICPVSNRFVVQDITATHIRRMLELGMLATVNSDDPAYFRAYMNENLHALRDEGNMSAAQIAQLVRNAFTVAWLDAAKRDAYLERLDRYLDRAA
jgi:adenosine deaminase